MALKAFVSGHHVCTFDQPFSLVQTEIIFSFLLSPQVLSCLSVFLRYVLVASALFFYFFLLIF